MTPDPFTPRRLLLGCAGAFSLLGCYAWRLGWYFDAATAAFWFAVSVALLLTIRPRPPRFRFGDRVRHVRFPGTELCVCGYSRPGFLYCAVGGDSERYGFVSGPEADFSHAPDRSP